MSATALPLVGAPRRRRIRWRQQIVGYLFIGPWISGILIFIAGPMIASFALAFTNYNVIQPPEFVGLANIQRLLGDPRIATALYNTAYYTFLGVPAQLTVALAMAVLLNQRVRFTNFFRSAFYVPTVAPAVAMIYLWVWMFNYDFGLINGLLRMVGLAPVQWLWDPAIAKPAIILFSLTRTGSEMIIFLAALQGVPDELHESAAIDGATAWNKFRFVTLPMISPLIFLNLVLGIIGSFQVFTVAFIATHGGPVDATLFFVLYLYHHGFENLQMGYASTMAWLLFIVIMVITFIQFRVANRWVYYESAEPGRVR